MQQRARFPFVTPAFWRWSYRAGPRRAARKGRSRTRRWRSCASSRCLRRLPPDTSNVYDDDLRRRGWASSSSSSALIGEARAVQRRGDRRRARERGRRKVVSCASCHDPLTAGADQRSRPQPRPAWASATPAATRPTVINAAYSPLWQFWDGRADSLWSQALRRPEGPAECAAPAAVAHALHRQPIARNYDDVFGARALPDDLLAASMAANCRPTESQARGRLSGRSRRPEEQDRAVRGRV